MTGLYVHIPFCTSKCPYCHFTSFAGRQGDIPRYLAALKTELSHFQSTSHPVNRSSISLDTLYFGGGTPTVLESAHWRELLGNLRRHFTFGAAMEITVEANPESVTEEKLRVLRELGVNRLSLGLQSTRDTFLKKLGRAHTFGEFWQGVQAARRCGLRNMSADLMYGLPGQTFDEGAADIQRLLDFGLQHISLYAFTVEEGTPFAREKVGVNDDLQADLYEAAHEILAGAGYKHYEISNFARPGFECRHNLKYWKNQECLGVGVGAARYQEGVRRKNTDNLDDYLRAVESGLSPVMERSELSPDAKAGEDLMLGLRLAEGVKLNQHSQRLYGGILERFVQQEYLARENHSCYRPTLKGWLFSNNIFRELISPGIDTQ